MDGGQVSARCFYAMRDVSIQRKTRYEDELRFIKESSSL